MAQNEMKAEPALPERVRSMEGLGRTAGELHWGSLTRIRAFQYKACRPIWNMPIYAAKICSSHRALVPCAEYKRKVHLSAQLCQEREELFNVFVGQNGCICPQTEVPVSEFLPFHERRPLVREECPCHRPSGQEFGEGAGQPPFKGGEIGAIGVSVQAMHLCGLTNGRDFPVPS